MIKKPITGVLAAFGLLTMGAVAFAQESETRSVDSFDKVALNGFFDVDIEVGPSQSVTIMVEDEDDLQNVETEVEDGVLHLDWDRKGRRSRWMGSNNDIRVIVTVPALSGVAINGSGDLTATGVDSEEFMIRLRGSGDIEVRGTCGTSDINLRGSGDIEARGLECESTVVSLRGSGDIEAFASQSADVELTGSGDITVFGSPSDVDTESRGSGDIRVRE